MASPLDALRLMRALWKDHLPRGFVMTAPDTQDCIGYRITEPCARHQGSGGEGV